MIYVDVDELTPCLKNAKTGEIVQTEVIRVKRKSFLRKYNKDNGWYINWDQLTADYEIYALVVEGSVDIQGLIALTKDPEMQAVYVAWMCASPENNRYINAAAKYIGVGGHLFAIAVQKSREYRFGGALYGFAANKALLKHYIQAFGGEYIGVLHPYQFIISEDNATKISEVYDYGYVDEEI